MCVPSTVYLWCCRAMIILNTLRYAARYLCPTLRLTDSTKSERSRERHSLPTHAMLRQEHSSSSSRRWWHDEDWTARCIKLRATSSHLHHTARALRRHAAGASRYRSIPHSVALRRRCWSLSTAGIPSVTRSHSLRMEL